MNSSRLFSHIFTTSPLPSPPNWFQPSLQRHYYITKRVVSTSKHVTPSPPLYKRYRKVSGGGLPSSHPILQDAVRCYIVAPLADPRVESVSNQTYCGLGATCKSIPTNTNFGYISLDMEGHITHPQKFGDHQ